MADCRNNSEYIMKAAVIALSNKKTLKEHMERIFAVAPNPYPEGRLYETQNATKRFSRQARGLIWC